MSGKRLANSRLSTGYPQSCQQRRAISSFIREAVAESKLFQNLTRSPAATLVPLSTFVSRSLITTAYASVNFDSAWS